MMRKMNVEILVKAIKVIAPKMEVTVNKVQKGNVILTGISIGNETIRPIMYVEHFENMYEELGLFAVAERMVKLAKESVRDNISTKLNVDKTTMWEYAKEHLRLCIAPKETNKGCVVYPYLDLELYVRVTVASNDNGTASYKVKREMLDTWGITTIQLLHEAIKCTNPLYKVSTIGEEIGFYEENSMVVLKTYDSLYGASVMYCKDILKSISDKMESDLIILPSSIHEILILSTRDLSFGDASEMVRCVNASELDPSEVLSDHAYIFYRDTMEITW